MEAFVETRHVRFETKLPEDLVRRIRIEALESGLPVHDLVNMELTAVMVRRGRERERSMRLAGDCRPSLNSQ